MKGLHVPLPGASRSQWLCHCSGVLARQCNETFCKGEETSGAHEPLAAKQDE